MAKTFTYKINSDPEVLIATAKQKSAESGITFAGNATSGSIEGKGFAGEYRIEGDRISLTFDKKPAFVPWSLIESKLSEQVKKW
jgi:hypothetical protein